MVFVIGGFFYCLFGVFNKASNLENASQNSSALVFCAWLSFLSDSQFGPDSDGLMYKVLYMPLGLLTVSSQSLLLKEQIRHCHLH